MNYQHNDHSYSYYDHYNTEYYNEDMINFQSNGANYESHYETKQSNHEMYLYETLSREIECQTDEITKQVNIVTDYRNDIKNQIEKIAIDTFCLNHKNIEAHVYGSVATGLALLESDMDIVITGIKINNNRDTHVSNMSELFKNIKTKFNSLILIKAEQISNTYVPIIKLKFSLKEYYSERINNDISSLPYINFESDKCINPILNILSVDISISDMSNDSSHLGIYQSNFVREKLQEFPVLRPVCLILKKLLVINKLNNPYLGGLGSFSLFLMLYTSLFLECTNSYEEFHHENVYPARLFLWFLTYFSEYFNYKTQAIKFNCSSFPWITSKLFCGIEKIQDLSTLCVYDPFDERNNTSSKVFKIDNIIYLFSQAKQCIQHEYEDIFRQNDYEETTVLDKLLSKSF